MIYFHKIPLILDNPWSIGFTEVNKLHFGFKLYDEKTKAWLLTKPNRSQTIRDGLTLLMSRESAPQPQERTHYEPKSRAHAITSRSRVSTRGGFHAGKNRPNRCAQAQHIRRRRGKCLSREEF